MGKRFLTIRRSFLLAIAVAGLLLAGCGGDGESDTVSVETGNLSKKEFIQRADVICENVRRKFTQEYTAFAKTIKPTASKEDLDAFGSKLINDILIPNFQKDVEEISALGAPSGDEEEVSAFLTAIQQRLGEIRERPAILEETITPFAKAEKLAKAYGLTGCAESFS